MTQYTISFAGAGRVAGALCRVLYSAGHKIDLIVSESKINGPSLARECNARWSDELIFPGKQDIIIVAVPDNRIEEVLNDLYCDPETLVVHSAGSFGLSFFPSSIVNRGVFYPLQTFSHGRKVSFIDLPVFIESEGKGSFELLSDLAASIGAKVFNTDALKRRQLHLAAVFANNFSNHMLASSREITNLAGFDFSVMMPLITETYHKAIESGPENVQTGPAMRNDLNTIERHIELLGFSNRLSRLYSEVTNSIINTNIKQL